MALPRFVPLAAAMALGAAACGRTDTSTQITVAIVAETKIPDELNGLEVTVTGADGSEVFRTPYLVREAAFFPTTLALVPRSDKSLEGPITIEVNGQGAAKLRRRARVSYVRGRTLLLPIPLRMACFGFRDCQADQSCVGGECVSADVEATSLSDYDDRYVFASDASCFDEATCLSEERLATVDADCTFPLPADAPPPTNGRPHVNVAVQWRDANNRIIALEHGNAQEGWMMLESGRGKLSAGVCTSYFEPGKTAEERAVPEKAEGIYVSTRCPAHVASQPYCPAADGHVAIGRTFR